MSLSERQKDILAMIRTNGRVEVDELSSIFTITTQTIRRDLMVLCARGLATRTHGGAKIALTVSNFGYQERRQFKSNVKERMGALAATLIPNDCSVLLSIGTSTEQVALALSAHDDLIIASNNINIINLMTDSKAKELIMVGGSVRKSDGAIVGGDAVETISRYKFDFAVIGTSALDDDGAVLDYDSREVLVNRQILRNARTKILVCDSSKFKQSASVRVCNVGDLDYFVTDAEPPASFRDIAENSGTQILVLEDNDVE